MPEPLTRVEEVQGGYSHPATTGIKFNRERLLKERGLSVRMGVGPALTLTPIKVNN
ncbi:MAG: hypothetical protein ABSH48_22715 [Verrucomicrobiota bacterium]|jgi:hypothetical protein